MKGKIIWHAAVVIGLMVFGASRADTYPDKPVRFIVAFPPGGNADLIARLIGQKLAESFKQTFVMDNRGGAGGMVGERAAAKAAPDGYTIVLVSLAHVVNPNLKKEPDYDPIKELVPVSLVVSVPNVVMVHNSLAVNSIPELIALAKSKPGQLSNVASLGTSLYMAGELFKSMTGVNIVAVNYRSGSAANADFEAGRVQVSFPVITSAISLMKSGRLKALAVTSPKRSMVLPELPAVSEFVPGYELTGWEGILVPLGTPPALVSVMSHEIAAIIRNADVQTRLIALGADPIGSTPDQFSAFRKAEYSRIAKLLATTGMKSQ